MFHDEDRSNLAHGLSEAKQSYDSNALTAYKVTIDAKQAGRHVLHGNFPQLHQTYGCHSSQRLTRALAPRRLGA